jgi:hypothetical protein
MLKDQIKDYAEQAEEKADSFLDKVVKSKWTWAFLAAVVVLILF